MEVEELKQVVDRNAVEMREGFAKVEARFESVDERFESVDARFDSVDRQLKALRVEIRESGEETRRHLGVVIDRLMSQFEVITEAIDAKVDRKLADFEERLTHKFRKR
jgi:predicted nuclease with TOPRIM domain